MNKQASGVSAAAIAAATEATPFDLGAIDTVSAMDEGAEFEVKHPVTGKGVGIFITVLGKHSQVFRDIVDERNDRRTKEAAARAISGEEAPMTSAEEVHSRAVELIAACTIAWRSETRSPKGEVLKNEPVIVIRGEKLDFNIANVVKLYNGFPNILEQADRAVGDFGLFIKA